MEQFESSSRPQNDLSGSNNYQRKELFLDTKEHCFLCLRDTGDNGCVTEMSEEVCLRNICRYLNINACTILLKSLKGQPVLTAQEMKENETLRLTDRYDFSVILCPSCSSLAHKFSKMIAELEYLEMLLRDKVTQFQGILSQSNHHGTGRLKIFKDKLRDNCENPVEYRLVENLRQEAIRLSAAKARNEDANSLPKVLLRRLNQIPTTDAAFRGSKVPTPASNGPDGEEITSMATGTTEKAKEIVNLTNKFRLNVKHEVFVSDIEEDAMMVESVPSTDGIQEISTDPLGSSSPPPPPKQSKSTPAATVTPKTSSLTAKIFVSKIFDNNVRNFQYTPSDKSNFRSRSVCRICSLELQAKSIREHLVNDHVQIFFQHKMPPNMAQDTFMERCKTFLFSESNSAARLKSSGAGPGSKTRGLLCPYCKTKCGYEFMLRYHLIDEHFHILQDKFVSFIGGNSIIGIPTCEKIVITAVTGAVTKDKSEAMMAANSPAVLTLQSAQNVTISSISLPQSANNYSSAEVRKFVADIFESYFERLDKGSTISVYRCRLVCKCCNASLNGSFARQHLVKEHVEVLFRHKMSHNLSEEQFNDCCRNLLISETYSAPREKPTQPASIFHKSTVLCAYCSVRQNDENALRFHLVTEHYHILEEKLTVIQQSTCPDNLMYFAEDGNSGSEDLIPGMTDLCKPVINDSGQVEGMEILEQEETISSCASQEIFMPGTSTYDDQQDIGEILMETDNPSYQTPVTEKPTATVVLPTRSSPSIDTQILAQPCWKNLYETIQNNNATMARGHKCMFCPRISNWTYIRRHVVNQHPEKLFASIRSAALSEEEFKRQCTELIGRVTRQGIRDKSAVGANKCRQQICCSFCNESYSNRFQLRYHVVADHYAILQEKLTTLQNKSV